MAIQREKTEKTLSKSIINASEVNFCARISQKREKNVKKEISKFFDATSRKNRQGIKSARKVCLWRTKNKLKNNYRNKNKSCRIVQGHLLKKELVQVERNELILTGTRELWFPK